jgi:hypothetical protein
MSILQLEFSEFLAECSHAGMKDTLARRRLFRLCEDHLDQPLSAADTPAFTRTQLSRDIVTDIEALCELLGLQREVLAKIDYSDYGTAAALLARLLDPEATDPIAAIRAEIALGDHDR